MADIDHRSLVKRWAAAVNAHDLDRIAEVFGDESLILDLPQLPLRTEWGEQGMHTLGKFRRGPERVKLYYGDWFAAIPDFRVILTGMIAAGDQAAVELTFQGTQKHDFLGIPARGNLVGVRAVAMLQLRDNKIHEQRFYYDLATLRQQMTDETGA